MFTFDHVHIVCRDIPAMGAFLEVLGARERVRNEATKNWEYDLAGMRIFVRAHREGETFGPGTIRRDGLDHLAFTVPDLDAAVARLVAAGARVAIGPTQVRPDLATCFVEGPDGLYLEVIWRG
ncbi:MAG TPA: VOC family protein [Bauldia sp.]|nr:VOC family protein [Bauldia sp.]